MTVLFFSDVAATLFAERRFAGADTQELADRVGVGKGASHFSTPQRPNQTG